MQPIFKELIQMWSDLNCPLPIEEGRFWLDNHFVIAFDNTGGGNTSSINTKSLMISV